MQILKRQTRLRVKARSLPDASPILGEGVDVMAIPDGHLSCPKCQGFRWECWVVLDAHRLELGCFSCGYSARLFFPLDIDLFKFGASGRFTCLRWDKETGKIPVHQDKAMIVIKNSDVLCVGCEACRTEVRIDLITKTNLVLAQ
jgi:hypothetical protein